MTELEVQTGTPAVLDSSKNLAERLKTLEQEFKHHQLAIIDLTVREDDLDEEQRALDDNDDVVSELHIRIQRLINSATLSTSLDMVSMAIDQAVNLDTCQISKHRSISSRPG